MKKTLTILLLTIVSVFAFGQSLHHAATIGQSDRNQATGRGFWVKADTALFTSKLWIPFGGGSGKVLTSDANGFATWQTAAGGSSFNRDSVLKYAWGITGNAGTNPSTNFVGTNDGVTFPFRSKFSANNYSGGTATAGQSGTNGSLTLAVIDSFNDDRMSVEAIGATQLLRLRNSNLSGGDLTRIDITRSAGIKFEHSYGGSYTFPSNDGTNGQNLSTDGAGNLLWTDASGGGGWGLTGNAGTNTNNFIGSTDGANVRVQSGFGNDSLPERTTDLVLTSATENRGGKFALFSKDSIHDNLVGVQYDSTLDALLLSNSAYDFSAGMGVAIGKANVGIGNGADIFGGTAPFNVNDNGNVGIGTATPTGLLQVFKNATNYLAFKDFNGFSQQFYVELQDSSLDNFGKVTIDANVETGTVIKKINADEQRYGLISVGDLSVAINAQGLLTNGSLTVTQNGTAITQGLQYTDGTQAAGKVLTSDADGNATWQSASTTPLDSATIYALTPTLGTQYYCTDCTGNGITGRIVAYIGAAWRRLTFED